MLHLVMQFQSSSEESTTDGNNVGGGRAFESLSFVLIIGVLVLGLIPGCGPP
jgi:hypothetical protein